MANEFKVVQPTEYHKAFLEENVREDGRRLDEFRPTIINIGSITTADGSALVNIGDMKVICGIKAEIATPDMNEPKNGFIIPNVDLPALCSPKFKVGPPPELAQVASTFVDTIIRKSECINLEDLCITEGKMVFALYCDLICLDYNGNLLDACVMALMAALKSATLPSVEFDENGLPVVNFQKTNSLRILNTPVSTTFAVFDNKVVFVDPTSEEEELGSDVVTVVTMDDGHVCTVYKPGGAGLSETQMQQCIMEARSHENSVRHLINDTIDSVER